MKKRIRRILDTCPGALDVLKQSRAAVPRVFFSLRHRRVVQKYLESTSIRKLHLGCGPNVLDGWLNTDISASKERIYLDAGKPFPFPDGTFDYVYSEHVIEHISYPGSLVMLSETYRVLKSGGKVRISTPNLRFLIELFETQKTDVQRRYIEWSRRFFPDGAVGLPETFVLNNFVRLWGHRFIYDEETLRSTLTNAGFTNLTKCSVGESSVAAFRGIEHHDAAIQPEFNRLESQIFEANRP